jgi:hypothetical protein
LSASAALGTAVVCKRPAVAVIDDVDGRAATRDDVLRLAGGVAAPADAVVRERQARLVKRRACNGDAEDGSEDGGNELELHDDWRVCGQSVVADGAWGYGGLHSGGGSEEKRMGVEAGSWALGA